MRRHLAHAVAAFVVPHAPRSEFAVFGGEVGVSSVDPRPTMHFFVGTAKEASKAF